jgi:hypothetical protein
MPVADLVAAQMPIAPQAPGSRFSTQQGEERVPGLVISPESKTKKGWAFCRVKGAKMKAFYCPVFPANAPLALRGVIEAANQIDDLPYIWGGGHGSFSASGYDCSGSVSFALHGGGFLSSPLDSTGLEVWGEPGGGNWITVFANSGHAWAYIAGLRWDTGGPDGGNGPRWSTVLRDDTSSFVARHPAGY